MESRLNYYLDGSIFKKGEDFYLNRVEVLDKTGFHAHDFLEIACIESGDGIHRIGETSTACTAGDYFIINAHEPHEFIPAKKCMIVCNLVFRPESVDYTLFGCKDFNAVTGRYLTGSFLPRTAPSLLNIRFHNPDIQPIFNQMLKEYTEKKPGYAQIIRAKLIELLVTTLRSFELEDLPSAQNEHDLYSVTRYIKEHISDTIPTETLAMMAFLSPAHFCRQFKKYTSMTVTEFTKKVRMQEAAQLLQSGSLSVIDVAEQVGYHDVKHFSKVFKQHMQTSPAKYRKGIGND